MPWQQGGWQLALADALQKDGRDAESRVKQAWQFIRRVKLLNRNNVGIDIFPAQLLHFFLALMLRKQNETNGDVLELTNVDFLAVSQKSKLVVHKLAVLPRNLKYKLSRVFYQA